MPKFRVAVVNDSGLCVLVDGKQGSFANYVTKGTVFDLDKFVQDGATIVEAIPIGNSGALLLRIKEKE